MLLTASLTPHPAPQHLNTGVMLAFVQSCGRHPEFNDVWNMWVKPGATSVAHSFCMRLGIWSGSGVLELLIFS